MVNWSFLASTKSLCFIGDGGKYHQPFVEYADGSKESISWNEVLESCKVSSGVDYQVNIQSIFIYDAIS